jgi:hypothetical protein
VPQYVGDEAGNGRLGNLGRCRRDVDIGIAHRDVPLADDRQRKRRGQELRPMRTRERVRRTRDIDPLATDQRLPAVTAAHRPPRVEFRHVLALS